MSKKKPGDNSPSLKGGASQTNIPIGMLNV